MTPASTPEQAYAALKRACQKAYAELQSRFSSKQVEGGTGVSASVVRKLAAEGDKTGWRPPTKRTCARIDEYCLTRLGHTYNLLQLREALDKSGWSPDRRPADQAADQAIRAYLTYLQHVLLAAPPWTPFTLIGDGFQRRMVSASHTLPQPTGDDELASARLQRGDVPWASALIATQVAVVIADAGYGKSWQTRLYAGQLANEALEDGEPRQSPIPLWLHAGDLAQAWPGSNPAEALVEAATIALRRDGIDTRAMQDALVTLITDGETPLTITVDAYDEVVGDHMRATARRALLWLSSWIADRSAYQLLLTSRAAGYDDPLAPVTDDRAEPIYLHLGALDEAQVRRLWQAWFDRRQEAVPADRLEGVLAPGSALRQFARIPLIAAFCAWVAESETVAATRSQLFDQVVQRFLARGWKSSDLGSGAEHGDAEDGARRASMAAALSELAWTMGCQDRWTDSISVRDCEAVLARRGPTPVPGRAGPARAAAVDAQATAGAAGNRVASLQSVPRGRAVKAEAGVRRRIGGAGAAWSVQAGLP